MKELSKNYLYSKEYLVKNLENVRKYGQNWECAKKEEKGYVCAKVRLGRSFC